LLCELDPKHKPFVVVENGQEVLYVRLIKALYGCVKSALLWYELFSSTLQTMGFVLNPYDRCVANCTIEGKQCTIGWYVDDTKNTHENPNVVTQVLNKLESEFGKMSITRGDEHTFLGMKITYNRKKRTATVDMKDYLVEAITESGLAVTKTAMTPAAKDLFSVSAASPFLTKRQQEVFHSVVAKLLYVSIRARMDLLLTTSFLATRVSKSTQQDLDKLQRLLEYIYGSIDDVLVLGSDDIGRFRVWVDASYAVHPDFRSHTGGCMSFGNGAIACKSTKQKLNTKSSTEAEIVGASDYMLMQSGPKCLWKLKATTLPALSWNRTMRAPSSSLLTAVPLPVPNRDTSTSVISGSKTELVQVISPSGIVPRIKCSRIFLLSPSRVLYSSVLKPSSLDTNIPTPSMISLLLRSRSVLRKIIDRTLIIQIIRRNSTRVSNV
jgi:hypothetical protein